MSAPAGPYTVTFAPTCICTDADDPNDHRKDCPSWGNEPKRWAYATLEEAWPAVADPICTDSGSGVRTPKSTYAWSNLRLAFEALPAAGGTLTLPDGSEIVVEATTYHELWKQVPVGRRGGAYFETEGEQNLAAWNAEYGIGEGA